MKTIPAARSKFRATCFFLVVCHLDNHLIDYMLRKPIAKEAVHDD
ncbi:hypothetical protein [Nitrosospira sp. Nsp1]|nr:hypothetical protein [Nitrosospira sp. Nsp1]